MHRRGLNEGSRRSHRMRCEGVERAADWAGGSLLAWRSGQEPWNEVERDQSLFCDLCRGFAAGADSFEVSPHGFAMSHRQRFAVEDRFRFSSKLRVPFGVASGRFLFALGGLQNFRFARAVALDTCQLFFATAAVDSSRLIAERLAARGSTGFQAG